MPKSVNYIGGEYASDDLLSFFKSNNLNFFPEQIKSNYASYYETGTDAIAAIIIEECLVKKNIKIWIPELYCFETINRLKLKLSNQDIVISEVLTYNEISEILPDCFSCIILNHYNIYKPYDFYQFAYNSFTIEDFVHAPFDIASFTADYAINSFRKFCSLELAIAYKKKDTVKINKTVSNYLQNKKEAQKIKTIFFETAEPSFETKYLELFQKADLCLFNDTIITASDDEIKKVQELDFKEIIDIRRRNYLYLKKMFESINSIKVLPGDYMYLIVDCSLRDELKSFLQKRNIYTVIHWLDSNSVKVQSKLSFHIDHRYNFEDLDRVFNSVKEFYGN